MRRASVLALALALSSCARDLTVPSSSPPRIDAVQVVGLEASAPPVPLPVLGGELVAIRGAGFPADAAQVEVRVGGLDAEVRALAPDRLVVKVPPLGASGAADLRVTTPFGFRAIAGALRYDGAGRPPGLGTSDVRTSVALGYVAPVQPPSSTGFPELAIATGAADSALLVVPEVGIAVTTIPLGLVPSSAAARFTLDANGHLVVQVLALARGGEAALGTAVLDSSASVVTRVRAQPLSTAAVTTRACTVPEVLFTNGGTPVAAWVNGAGAQRIATIDMAAAQGAGALYRPLNGKSSPLPAAVVGWTPWQLDSVVLAAGSEIYLYDAAGQADPAPMEVAPGTTVSSLLTAGCAGLGIDFIYTIAGLHAPYPPPPSAGTDVLAVSYRAGGVDRVALVNLTAWPAPGSVARGIAGTIPTSLALAPDPPYAPTSWSVLAAGITNLYRFRPVANVPGSCADDLVPDAALPLSSTPGILPTFGGMVTAANGTRVLTTTPDQDLWTVLPPTLTSAGAVLRVASYGGVAIQPATVAGTSVPIAVAEHAASDGGLGSLDTGSALLVLSLAGDEGSVALGGSGYGRGAVWLDGGAAGGALAYAGDLPSSGAATFSRGGAAAVTAIGPGVCPGEDVHIGSSRPVIPGPDLVAQGPARSGALGPEGIARFGPASAPVYAVKDAALAAIPTDGTTLACLAAGGDWSTCAAPAPLDLGVSPLGVLDVSFSAGDATAAVRTLEPDLGQCAQATGFPAPASCGTDLLCLRASCPPARSLVLARAGATPATVALPGRPAGISADRAGGFLVTLPCAATAGAGGGTACFPGDPLCGGILTGPGGADGALVLVPEDGSAARCLAVLPGLGGPVAVTPNGEEAWITGPAFGAQILTRMALARRTGDGAIDDTAPASRISAESLGAAARPIGAFPPGGVAFTPDGSTGIVTVPGEFRILLYR